VIENTGVDRILLTLAGIWGALAVGLGAYGAHGLTAAPERMEWWRTAVLYHLVHAVMIAVASRVDRRPAHVAGVLFALGSLLFSGTLYAMTLGAPRLLGAVTPLGGLSLILGWIALALAALKRRA
jgi:uncharacterized membrane protein YgdD (TMEM256/DUF423 family)